MKRTVLLIGTLCLLASISQAAVIYDNGATSPATSGRESTQWVSADDFSIVGGGSVASASIYVGSTAGTVPSRWDGTLDYFVFADAAGTPGGLLAFGAGENVALTDNGIGWPLGGNEYRFGFDLASPFAAAAGTTYWLGIHLSADFDNDALFWITGGEGNMHNSLGGTFDNWVDTPARVALTLSGTPLGSSEVPEPTTVSLLGASLLGLMWMRRKRS